MLWPLESGNNLDVMIGAIVFAAAVATASPATGVGPPTSPKQAQSHASREFSGMPKPGMGTSPPLLQKSAPALNTHATAGPLLRKAAPGASPNNAGRNALRSFSSAGTQANPTGPGMGNQGARWGWFGLFGVLGLVGLWRRYSGS